MRVEGPMLSIGVEGCHYIVKNLSTLCKAGCNLVLFNRQSSIWPHLGSGIMATPQSITVVHAGLSKVLGGAGRVFLGLFPGVRKRIIPPPFCNSYAKVRN